MADCITCKKPMKQLFVSEYCKDAPKGEQYCRPKATTSQKEIQDALKDMYTPRLFVPISTTMPGRNGVFPLPAAPATPAPAHHGPPCNCKWNSTGSGTRKSSAYAGKWVCLDCGRIWA